MKIEQQKYLHVYDIRVHRGDHSGTNTSRVMIPKRVFPERYNLKKTEKRPNAIMLAPLDYRLVVLLLEYVSLKYDKL